MRAAITVLVAALVLAISSCIPSVHPVYDEDTRVYDAALLGTWKAAEAQDSSEAWVFGPGLRDSDNYVLEQTDETGLTGNFTVNLAEFGGSRYLDLFPQDSNSPVNGFYELHMFRVHTFMQVELEADTLRMYLLDFNWLDEQLQSTPGVVEHVYSNRVPEVSADGNEFPLLTARTPKLQAWLASIADTPGAWTEALELSREDL